MKWFGNQGGVKQGCALLIGVSLVDVLTSTRICEGPLPNNRGTYGKILRSSSIEFPFDPELVDLSFKLI